MMQVNSDSKFPIKMWTDGVPVEDQAMQQLRNIADMPFIHKHVAVMPDVHLGMGATVGSVIPTKGAIIPAAVGVDIGCGMMAQQLNLKASDLPDNLKDIRDLIEKAVPHGRTDNGGFTDRGSWGLEFAKDRAEARGAVKDLLGQYNAITDKHPKCKTRNEAPIRHMGTLGTGNHFIELCLDTDDNVWIMLHSGSRGTGNRIGMYFIERAKEEMRRWYINIPDQDLAYFPEGSDLFNDYWDAVDWAQRYARLNRELMMEATFNALQSGLNKEIQRGEDAVNCHHNYVAIENHHHQNVFVTRKGAVSARAGQLGIIPGSMGAKSFIVRGLGNRDSFMSCSHGAGRKMSRTVAKKTFTLEEHAAATAGVECKKDASVLDETPGAYKDIDAVMAAQDDLVDVVAVLKQVLCVKG